MKVKELLAAVRDMKPTVQSDAALIRYLNEIEGTAQTEVLNIDYVDVVEYTVEDGEKELLIGKPHHKLYIYYLMAMVDFGDGEYQKYQNGMQMANSAFSEWAKWWQRTYGTGCNCKHTVYLSAYGIAVKHGYTGTEKEWLESLKGDPFAYEDFTEEQLAELREGVVQDTLDRANRAASSAEQSAAAADQAKTGAKNSLDQVIVYEQSVARAAANAKAAETNAGMHANAAAGYMSAAAKSATEAKTSETNAKNSEATVVAASNAAVSAANAAARSESNAASAASEAQQGKAAAAQSAQSAESSAAKATTSEANAKAHENAAELFRQAAMNDATKARNAATEAAQSERAAAGYAEQAQSAIGRLTTFDIDPETGELMMYKSEGYTGPAFSINEYGELEVEVDV